MDAQKIKEAVIRSEGYSEGFAAGYRSCANFIVNELEKEQTTQAVNPPVKE